MDKRDSWDTLQGRDDIRRKIAIGEANERCAIQYRELDEALQAAREDRDNPIKLDVLKRLAKKSRSWGTDGANAFASDGSSLRTKARIIQEEFGFTEEK